MTTQQGQGIPLEKSVFALFGQPLNLSFNMGINREAVPAKITLASLSSRLMNQTRAGMLPPFHNRNCSKTGIEQFRSMGAGARAGAGMTDRLGLLFTFPDTIHGMKHIWSPWRMKYIEGHGSGGGCIFCEALKQSDEQALIVARLPRAFAILNRYPYTGGHLMIVPVEHADSIEKLSEADWLEMFTLTRKALAALRKVYRTPAFNLGANIGECAGAGVADHVHLHVVPRWSGDTNFMSVLGQVRVLPESLEDTWRKMRKDWEGR